MDNPTTVGALPNSNLTILARRTGGTTSLETGDQIAYAFLATGLVDADVTAIYGRLHTYTTAYSLTPC